MDDLTSNCKIIYIEADHGAISLGDFKERLDILINLKPPKEEEKRPACFEFVTSELEEMKAANQKYGSLKIFTLRAGNLEEFAKYQLSNPASHRKIRKQNKGIKKIDSYQVLITFLYFAHSPF